MPFTGTEEAFQTLRAAWDAQLRESLVQAEVERRARQRAAEDARQAEFEERARREGLAVPPPNRFSIAEILKRTGLTRLWGIDATYDPEVETRERERRAQEADICRQQILATPEGQVALPAQKKERQEILATPLPKDPADLPKVKSSYRSPLPPPKLRPWEEEEPDDGGDWPHKTV